MESTNNPSKQYILLGIWKHLSKKRKKQIIFLPIIILLAGISEVFSIASIVPFLTILSEPNKVSQIKIIKQIYEIFKPISDIDPFLISIYLFLTCVSFSAIFRLITIYSINFFSASVGSDFSKKAYRLSLNQPYSTHIKRNSSSVISSIISNTDRVVSVIISLLNLSTAIIIGIALIYSIFVINWIISIIIALIFISLYFLLGINLKKKT